MYGFRDFLLRERDGEQESRWRLDGAIHVQPSAEGRQTNNASQSHSDEQRERGRNVLSVSIRYFTHERELQDLHLLACLEAWCFLAPNKPHWIIATSILRIFKFSPDFHRLPISSQLRPSVDAVCRAHRAVVHVQRYSVISVTQSLSLITSERNVVIPDRFGSFTQSQRFLYTYKPMLRVHVTQLPSNSSSSQH